VEDNDKEVEENLNDDGAMVMPSTLEMGKP
jgi:hypothetical protein